MNYERFAHPYRHVSHSGLSETGLVDDATLDLMKMPRCGMKDDIVHDGNGLSNIRDVQKVGWLRNSAKGKNHETSTLRHEISTKFRRPS
jgi:hypothetical protein